MREHTDYINAILIRQNVIFTSSGDSKVIIHEYPNSNIVEEIPKAMTDFEVPPIQCPPSPVDEQIEVIDVIEEVEDTVVIDEEEIVDIVEETKESEGSESSSNTDTPKRRKRRWLIDRDEIELKEEIGKGRYGIVYKGIYKEKVVAVKISNKLTRQEYSRAEEGIIKEVGSFCRCKHPALVKYFGLVANKLELTYWLVTEWVTGHSMAQLVRNHPLITSDSTLDCQLKA